MICLISSIGFLFNQVHLGDTHNVTESDFEHLAHKTKGFSGSDIAVCVSVKFTLVLVSLLSKYMAESC